MFCHDFIDSNSVNEKWMEISLHCTVILHCDRFFHPENTDSFEAKRFSFIFPNEQMNFPSISEATSSLKGIDLVFVWVRTFQKNLEVNDLFKWMNDSKWMKREIKYFHHWSWRWLVQAWMPSWLILFRVFNFDQYQKQNTIYCTAKYWVCVKCGKCNFKIILAIKATK